MLAAFRSLVKVKGNRVSWERNPFTFWKVIQKKAVRSIIDRAKEMEKPAYISKETSVWENLYRMFEIEKGKM